MSVGVTVVDAFTDEAYGGNPAAVVLLDGGPWPDEAWMRRVAVELSLSETAFARPLEPGRSQRSALRWFTPVVEDDICGHATLATAHVIRTRGLGTERLVFAIRAGT